jgi:hypothetical protein
MISSVTRISKNKELENSLALGIVAWYWGRNSYDP